jgi:hypothetical protein
MPSAGFDPSNQAAADLLLRPRGHRDRLVPILLQIKYNFTTGVFFFLSATKESFLNITLFEISMFYDIQCCDR